MDQLKRGGQKYWQILPLGPTGYGDSPYQSFSTFAGNPFYIDLEALIQEGLLTEQECDSVDFTGHPSYVEYEKIYRGKFGVLRQAFERYVPDKDYEDFVKENAFWLEDYGLYMAIKNSLDGVSWGEWEDSLKRRVPEVLEQKRRELEEEVRFVCFQQYEFTKQWAKLKKYANDQGVRIIGDIPIYVAFDSADAWTKINENVEKIKIAKDNVAVADENLDLNTFSYNEGRLTILDVLSAQAAWISAYTSMITVWHSQHVAISDYNKATAYIK